MSQFLLLLAVIPLSCYYLSNTYRPKLRWRLTGIGFGMVIAPISLYLLKYLYVPFFGKVFGLIGLVLNLIHGSVGYFLIAGMGFLEPNAVLSAAQLTVINLLNGVIWATYYGIVGYHFDMKGSEAHVRSRAFEGYEEKVKL